MGNEARWKNSFFTRMEKSISIIRLRCQKNMNMNDDLFINKEKNEKRGENEQRRFLSIINLRSQWDERWWRGAIIANYRLIVIAIISCLFFFFLRVFFSRVLFTLFREKSALSGNYAMNVEFCLVVMKRITAFLARNRFGKLSF